MQGCPVSGHSVSYSTSVTRRNTRRSGRRTATYRRHSLENKNGEFMSTPLPQNAIQERNFARQQYGKSGIAPFSREGRGGGGCPPGSAWQCVRAGCWEKTGLSPLLPLRRRRRTRDIPFPPPPPPLSPHLGLRLRLRWSPHFKLYSSHEIKPPPPPSLAGYLPRREEREREKPPPIILPT